MSCVLRANDPAASGVVNAGFHVARLGRPPRSQSGFRPPTRLFRNRCLTVEGSMGGIGDEGMQQVGIWFSCTPVTESCGTMRAWQSTLGTTVRYSWSWLMCANTSILNPASHSVVAFLDNSAVLCGLCGHRRPSPTAALPFANLSCGIARSCTAGRSSCGMRSLETPQLHPHKQAIASACPICLSVASRAHWGHTPWCDAGRPIALPATRGAIHTCSDHSHM